MKKISEYILTGALLMGCAFNKTDKPSADYLTIQINNTNYKIENYNKLINISRINNGTIIAYKTSNGYFIDGLGLTHEPLEKDYFEKIIKLADINEDKRITNKEIDNLEKKILERKSKK
jgi:hypothetical protein